MHFETVIIGAGPSGLKCAEFLADEGRQVLVLEKDSVIGNKVCAGGLTRKDFELNIPDSLIQRKFKKITIRTSLQTTVIKSKNPFLATINRKDLGKWMADNAKKAGAQIQLDSKVSLIKKNSLELEDGTKINFKNLVGADGSNSTVRKYLNIPVKKMMMTMQYYIPGSFKELEIFVNPLKFSSSYLWVFPHQKFASVGTGIDYRGEKSTILKEYLDKWCDARYPGHGAQLQAFPINCDYQGHVFDNIYLAGDAAGLASGLTGEGIYYAVRSGEQIANIINGKQTHLIKGIVSSKKWQEAIISAARVNKGVSLGVWETLNLMAKAKPMARLFFKNFYRGL